jgi:hypothetical protein
LPRLSVECHLLLTVHVDTDTGEVEYIYAHGDSFQDGPQELPAQVYTGHDPILKDDDETEEYLDESDPRHVEAIRIFNQLSLARPEFFVPFVLTDDKSIPTGEPTYGTLLPDERVSGWGERQHYDRLYAQFDAEKAKDARILDRVLEDDVTKPLAIGARQRRSPLAERTATRASG